MKKNVLIAVLILLLAVCFTSYLMIDRFYLSPFKIQEIKTDVSVTDERVVGLNVDTDGLHFGMFQAGQGSTRVINVTNDLSFPVKVNIIKDKSEVSRWVTITKNGFIVQPRSYEIVEIYCNIPKATPVGDYDGMIYLQYHRR